MARSYFPGVGEAVAARTINRPGEAWGDVARRVAIGNSELTDGGDREPLEAAIADGRILMSGRHLQHGDDQQSTRNIEVFTNCSTGSQRALIFYLLLNGSGVGTSYDDDMCIVDWSKMPNVLPVLDASHNDYTGEFDTPEKALWEHPNSVVFIVPDSREGWAEAVQFVEDLTFEGTNDLKTVILDFTQVRPKGAPIGGMQDRPSSGPIPIMQAMVRMNEIKRARLPLWRQAMELDHLLAEIVLVGGARRSARIAVKWWDDEDIFGFINCKREGGLWTANNSVGVDAEFWSLVRTQARTTRAEKAKAVFQACTEAQFQHGTGEPAFLNMDMLARGETTASSADDLHLNGRMRLSDTAIEHRRALMIYASKKPYSVIVNPCGEIRLSLNGGYCVIADIAVAFCDHQEQFNEAARLATRALVRTNLMPALYQGEVDRTNRIGVALTGMHEYAWQRFGLTFKDLVATDPHGTLVDANGNSMLAPADRALPFWHSLLEAAWEVEDELDTYCSDLGMVKPLTRRTIKPSGSVSKLFALTEGAHLAAMNEYLRWVQFRDDSPLVAEYEAAGYPTRTLTTYKNVVIVGFPTRLPIVEMMGDRLVTAADATFEEQIRWIRLLETYWLLDAGGNQISYTLKYRPTDLTEAEYQALVLEHVPLVRAVSVMPQIDQTAYEYQPEEPISAERYDELMSKINQIAEDIGQEHVECAGGFCPIDFRPRTSTVLREVAEYEAA